MRSLPLSVRLTLLSLLLVLVVAAGLFPTATALFERMAEDNARARVRLAALDAAEEIEQLAEEARTSARLLAERPTLLRLTRAHDRAALELFLERFRSTSHLDGCAVIIDGVPLAAVPPDLPWPALALPAGSDLLIRELSTGPPWAVAIAPVLEHEGTVTVAARRLELHPPEHLETEPAIETRLMAATAETPLAEGEIPPFGYRLRVPLGEGAGLWLEASLAAEEVARAVAPLQRVFAVVVLGAVLLAVLAGVFGGRLLARPLGRLRQAAQTIGSGDLSTPVPAVRGLEAGALSSTMEEMRQRLNTLNLEIRHQSAEAEALLTAIVEGVFAVDEERRIRYLNPQAAQMLGVDIAEATGRFCGDVLNPVGPDGRRPCEDQCPIIHARSRGRSRAVEDLQLTGGRRTVVITSAPAAGPNQVQVMRDETEIEAARRSRDAVLANVSHELKTPLSAQLASIELLRDGLAAMAPDEAQGLVATLERSTLRLSRLVDNLLESVRIETGQATHRREPVSLALVVEEAVAMTRPLIEQRGQHLAIELPEVLPEIVGDPGQLTQVVVNLLANALKYAPAGSAIRIGGGEALGVVTLWIEDAGPGVPPALSASIFDRFRRASTEGEGMGLGLWIAKSIVERHGGQILVGTASAGGARFTLTFPAAEAA